MSGYNDRNHADVSRANADLEGLARDLWGPDDLGPTIQPRYRFIVGLASGVLIEFDVTGFPNPYQALAAGMARLEYDDLHSGPDGIVSIHLQELEGCGALAHEGYPAVTDPVCEACAGTGWVVKDTRNLTRVIHEDPLTNRGPR